MLRFSRLIVIWTVAAGVMCASAALAEITPAQKDQLKSMAIEAREKIVRERQELMQNRRELMRVYGNYNLDERKAKALREKIGKSQLHLLNMHLDNQIAIRRVLNPEQFDAFEQRIKGRMGHHGPRMGDDDNPMDLMPDRDTMQAAGVTPDQAKRVFVQGGRGRRPIIDKLRADSTRLMDLYASYNLDVQAAKKLIAGIHQSQSDLSEINFKRQQAMRAVLTRAQFDRLQEEIAKRIRPHGEDRRPLGRRGSR